MKSLMSWFCLAAITNATLAIAEDGLDAYRLGQYDEASKLLVKTNSQDSVTQYYLSKMRLYGYGELKNNTLAIQHLKTAADQGFLPAQQIMARYELIEKNNLEQALVWFKKAAAANDVPAQMYCAAAYLFGLGVSKNSDTAKRYYIAAAKNGNSIAQATLAASFLETHQSANKKLGILWLNRALEQHNPEAQVMMSELYLNGGAVDRSIEKAKALNQLAVEQNYVPAYYQMGRLEQSQKNLEEAVKWYTKAASAQYESAELALGQLYLDSTNSIYNAQTGFLWMLKAAQNGSATAQLAIANLYEKGIGTSLDEHLAKEWKDKATKKASPMLNQAKLNAIQWLTNRNATQFESTSYALQGIWRTWHNTRDIQQHNYNQPPQLESLQRRDIFKPNFVMVNVNDVSISEYYDILIHALKHNKPTIAFPQYGLQDQLESAGGQQDAQKKTMTLEQIAALPDDQKTAYQALFKKLENQAILGDTSAQFDVAQLYQYGIGVKKDIQEAIRYYQLAAEQQDLPSEYNLGILYLTGVDVKPDYPLAINWLTDAAFKGNAYAQYVLACIYQYGYKNKDQKMVIPVDEEQGLAMFNLAAANNDGKAQYQLADILVRQKSLDLSLDALKKRHQLIKSLYAGAVAEGVAEATIPLAFYQAMEPDEAKQALAFKAADQAAGTGNKEAALLLGLMYDRGIGVKADPDQALNWYQQSGDNPVSAFILGTNYATGTVLSKDPAKARALLQKAADNQFSYALFNLAILKHEAQEPYLPDLAQASSLGNSVAGILMADDNLSKSNDASQLKVARDIYQRFAEKGDKEAQYKLGYLYDQGIGGVTDVVAAQHWYIEAAKQNQSVAQYLLGQLYQLGKLSKTPDYAEAKQWYAVAQSNYPKAAVALGFIYDTVDDNYDQAMTHYARAAQHDDTIGAFNLGLIYERGEGCAVDIEKAKSLYLKAAEKGHRQAMVQLAGLYLNDEKGWSHLREALNWYQKASDLGDRDAMYHLGLMAETGVGTKLDYAKAIEAYQAAADKGNVKAVLALARIYQYGLGVPVNLQESATLYTKLAAFGNPYAQYQLALFCFKGIPTGCQPAEGKKWLEKAQTNGSEEAIKALQRLNAASQQQVSFIEPVAIAPTGVAEDKSSDLMYLDALRAWDRGDEHASKVILSKLLSQYPNNLLAKQAYQQLMNVDISVGLNAGAQKKTALLK